MIVKTDLDLSLLYNFIIDEVIATSDGKDITDRFERRTHILHIRIRAKISGAIPSDLSCNEHTGIWFVGDHNVWIALVVLEINIVARFQLLYQVRFEDEGFNLVVCDNHFQIGGF